MSWWVGKSRQAFSEEAIKRQPEMAKGRFGGKDNPAMYSALEASRAVAARRRERWAHARKESNKP